jgi:hypothetical protein
LSELRPESLLRDSLGGGALGAGALGAGALGAGALGAGALGGGLDGSGLSGFRSCALTAPETNNAKANPKNQTVVLRDLDFISLSFQD